MSCYLPSNGYWKVSLAEFSNFLLKTIFQCLVSFFALRIATWYVWHRRQHNDDDSAPSWRRSSFSQQGVSPWEQYRLIMSTFLRKTRAEPCKQLLPLMSSFFIPFSSVSPFFLLFFDFLFFFVVAHFNISIDVVESKRILRSIPKSSLW